MAWNEPGGSNGRDPWGSRNDQGPPDLDELLRKLQRRFGGLLGGGGRSGGSGAMGAGVLVIMVVVALAIWVFSGFYIVDEGKRGVVLQFGAYNETTLPGLHWYPRFVQSVEIVDFDRIKVSELGVRNEEALMLTQDENLVDIKFTVQYKVKNPRDYLYNVFEPDGILRRAAESAVREVVGQSKMDFVLTDGRTEVATRATKLIQEILDGYKAGILVTSVNMQDAQAPDQVQGAFADAVKAREDEQRQINEAQAYANDILPRAGGQAARIVQDASGYRDATIARAEGETARFLSVLTQYQKAPEITRRRMYIDTLENVLGKAGKVVVDTSSGNVLYLPLDRLTEGRAAALPEQGRSAAATAGGGDASAARGNETRPRDNLRRREVR